MPNLQQKKGNALRAEENFRRLVQAEGTSLFHEQILQAGIFFSIVEEICRQIVMGLLHAAKVEEPGDKSCRYK